MSSRYDAEFFEEAVQEGSDILYGETGILAQLGEQDMKAKLGLGRALDNERYHAASAIFENLRDRYSLHLEQR